jgi:hypothetical protein
MAPDLSILLGAQSVAVTWPWGHTVLPQAEEQRVTSVAWSPDGKRLATASWVSMWTSVRLFPNFHGNFGGGSRFSFWRGPRAGFRARSRRDSPMLTRVRRIFS